MLTASLFSSSFLLKPCSLALCICDFACALLAHNIALKKRGCEQSKVTPAQKNLTILENQYTKKDKHCTTIVWGLLFSTTVWGRGFIREGSLFKSQIGGGNFKVYKCSQYCFAIQHYCLCFRSYLLWHFSIKDQVTHWLKSDLVSQRVMLRPLSLWNISFEIYRLSLNSFKM